jgi:hypothetical protein
MGFFNIFSQLCGGGLGQGAVAAGNTVAACTNAAATGLAGINGMFSMLCRLFGLGC